MNLCDVEEEKESSSEKGIEIVAWRWGEVAKSYWETLGT